MLKTNEVSVKSEKKMRQNKQEILALWQRTDSEGQIYYTGNLPDGTRVLAFYNKSKGDGNPALRIFKTDRKTSKSA